MKPPETILAIDYGRSRCGLALSRADFVAPLMTVTEKELINSIGKIVHEEAVDQIVIGLPEGSQQKKIITLRAKLIKDLSIPIHLYDEVLTTKQAKSHKKMFPEYDDNAIAAYLILKGYLSQ